jgi:hypothetical protein
LVTAITLGNGQLEAARRGAALKEEASAMIIYWAESAEGGTIS